MVNYITKAIGYAGVIVAVGLGAMGCQESQKKGNLADLGRNPDNNFIENIVVNLTHLLVGIFDTESDEEIKRRAEFNRVPSLGFNPDANLQSQRHDEGPGFYRIID